LTALVKQINDHRANHEEMRTSDPKITQELATQFKIHPILDKVLSLLSKLVPEGCDYFCHSTGTGVTKSHLMNESINGGRSLDDLY
jgi:hypothetical protein